MYNVIFKDGSITEVKNEEALLLLGGFQKGKEKFILNGAMRSFSNVKDIKPIEEVKPLSLPEVVRKMTPDRRKRAVNSVIRGFKKYFNGRTIPQKSQEMLNHFIKNETI